MNLSPRKRDELAGLAWSVSQLLTTPAGKIREVRTMLRTQHLDANDDDARDLIVRGGDLARQKGERV